MTRPRIAGGGARLAVVSLFVVSGLFAGFAILHYSDDWTAHRVGSDNSVRTGD
jgi:hypothetical protein